MKVRTALMMIVAFTVAFVVTFAVVVIGASL